MKRTTRLNRLSALMLLDAVPYFDPCRQGEFLSILTADGFDDESPETPHSF